MLLWALMKKARQSTLTRYPRKASDVFVTQKMLFQVRDELKAQTASSEQKLLSAVYEIRSENQGFKAEFESIRAEIHDIRSEMHDIRAEIHELRSDIHGVKSEVQALRADVHRIALLVEEQNNRNKIVLDGLTQLFERQGRIEEELRLRR